MLLHPPFQKAYNVQYLLPSLLRTAVKYIKEEDRSFNMAEISSLRTGFVWSRREFTSFNKDKMAINMNERWTCHRKDA